MDAPPLRFRHAAHKQTHTKRHENAQSHTRKRQNVASRLVRAPTPTPASASRVERVVCHVDVAGSNHTIYTYKQLCDFNQNYKHVRPTMAPPPPKKAIFGFDIDDTRRRRRRPNAETDDGIRRRRRRFTRRSFLCRSSRWVCREEYGRRIIQSVLGLRDHLLLLLEDDARKTRKRTERRGEDEKDEEQVKVSSCRRNRRNPSRSGRR